MNNTSLENHFIEVIKEANLWNWFIDEFGKHWKANDWYLEGWWFSDGLITHRSTNLFDNHIDGNSWSFYKNDTLRTKFVEVLKSNGYTIKRDSSDEQDGLFCMEIKNSVIETFWDDFRIIRHKQTNE